MRYVLLTWNPGPGDDDQYTPQQWLDEMVLPLREGRPPVGNRWSIGTNWRAIEVGDTVCMLRQGMHGRGIVATGVVTRSAYRDAHWDSAKSGDAWYVNVAWNRAMDHNQMITTDELERQVSAFEWRKVYSSGRIVDGLPAEQLATLLGQAPPPPKTPGKVGQQLGNAEHNRLVELAAMHQIAEHFRAKGYKVVDVSAKKLGWDLDVRLRTEVLYVEVKGVTGPLPEFYLTPNEHRAASAQAGWVAIVVTDIFSVEPQWHEFSGKEVITAAKPTQYRVSPALQP